MDRIDTTTRVDTPDSHIQNERQIKSTKRIATHQRGVNTAAGIVSSNNQHVQKAYSHGTNWKKPPLTDQAKQTGGYTRDVKPEGFDQTIEAREQAPTVQSEVIKCGVTEHAIDSTIFSDTNVLLEIVQNSESKDSKGTWFDVQFFAKGEWRSVVGSIQDFTDEDIKKIRIVDNGKGYMPQDMTTIGGAKRYDPESAGKFGSGMKLSDRIALAHGMNVRRFSRNWNASPYLDQGITSAGAVHTVSYNVQYSEDVFPGSVVEYENPTTELINALRDIENIYLPLDRTFEERLLAQNEAGIILKPKAESGQIMVAGRSYELTVPTEAPLLFSYDLHECAIDDQNRHFVDTSKVTANIRSILAKTTDIEIFRQLLKSIETKKRGFHEHTLNGLNSVPEGFLQAIKEHFCIKDYRKVYISNTRNVTKDNKALLNRKGYQGIEVPNSRFILETLTNIQVLDATKVVDDLTTAHNLNGAHYPDESFASVACRAIYALRNLDPDVESEIIVVLQHKKTGANKELPYGDFVKEKDQSEYDVNCLIVRTPGKRFQGETTDLVEYFKQYLIACNSAGVKTSVYDKTTELNQGNGGWGGNYIFIRDWSKCPPTELEIHIYIENQSQATELKKLHQYSLDLDENYQPFEKTAHGDIVQLDDTNIYEQGVRRKEKNHDSYCIFSYNFPHHTNDLASDVARIVENAKRPEVPVAILKRAKSAGEYDQYLEFSAEITDEEIRANWKAAFEEIFGKDAVLNDMQLSEKGSSARMVANSSGIKTHTLPRTLVQNLINCGVKVLSEAIKVNKAKVYKPNPLKAELLKITDAIDAIIYEALPPNVRMIKPRIVLAHSVSNPYGTELQSGNGYLNPTLEDNTIYVFDSVVTKGKIDQLVTFLLNKKTEVYSDTLSGDSFFKTFSEDDFLNFKSRVINIASRAITNVDFFNKVRKMIFNKKQRFGQLVEVLISESQTVEQEPEEDIVITGNIKETRWAITNTLHSLGRGVDATIANLRTIAAIGLRTAAKITATLAVTGAVIGGSYMAATSAAESDWLKKTLEKVEEIANTPGTKGYQRPKLRGNQPIGVSIERSSIQRTENTTGENYAHDALANFVTTPSLSWGYFMSEQSLTKYTGQGWEEDSEAPDFENPQYAHQKRFAHYQKTGGAKKIELRTRAGGFIDTNSIRLISKDGKQDLSFITNKLPNGEIKITILSENIEAILYQTASPINWQETAEKLTDQDFANIDPKALSYYTQTPDIDLKSIPFKSPKFPEFNNYQEFITHIKTLAPLERITAIRSVILKMRYTRTAKTEAAFTKFHNGKLPQKDFLEFILSSDQLENPGDGDCDTQNTIAALLFRYAGIPSKLHFVFTKKGVGHGPSSIFLPKIGWILSDTMGERTLVERISEEDPQLDSTGRESTEEQARARIIETLRRRAEFQTRECYKFQ